MFDKLKSTGDKAKDAIASAANAIGDLNGDGKVDEQDAKIAADWIKGAASSVGDEVVRLSKEAVRSDLAKDAAAGAAVGAVVAVPVPLIGPVAGAAIGAAVGMYKNLTKRSPPVQPGSIDMHGELLKLEDLRSKGLLTQDEFDQQKRKLLE